MEEIKTDKTLNLWNCVLNKTKRVIQYIQHLEPPRDTIQKQCANCGNHMYLDENTCQKCGSTKTEIKQVYDLNKFDKLKEQALNINNTPDRMLEIIGYKNHKLQPEIYDYIKVV